MGTFSTFRDVSSLFEANASWIRERQRTGDEMLGTICRKLADVFYGGLGFDLGTANTVVYARGKGIVINQPSFVAFSKNGDARKKIVAMGEPAREMVGRAPHDVQVIAPIEEGLVADADAVEAMLEQLVRKAYGNDHFLKPFGIIGVPPNASDIARRATSDVAGRADLPAVYLIDEIMAAALGAGLNVLGPKGIMVVDIGGGTTDVAVMSLGGIIVSSTSRLAGKALDRQIVEFLKQTHDLYVGEHTAEEVKIAIGNTHLNGNIKMNVRGKDLRNGLPKTVEVSEHELYHAIRKPVDEILLLIRKVLEATPPELSSDIIDNGITLVGGGSLLRGLDVTISEETGIPVSVAEEPLTCAAHGLGKITEDFNKYKSLLGPGANA